MNEALNMLLAQGLQALKAGAEIGKAASSDNQQAATNPDLKAALQAGAQTSEHWAQRIKRALAETGGADDVGNPVLEAHYEVSKQIRQKAPDDQVRDLGIIAAGQLALHYWIASFGTLRTYASQVGLTETQQAMQTSLEEAKQFDQGFTALAEKLLASRG